MDAADDDLLHVLVIDDDSEVRELLTRIVLRAGHQVVPAGSAEAGLELLPYYTFQVALIDQHLPGMEGLVLGEFLRRNNAHMKIALISGMVDEDVLRFAREQQIAFIAKPFEVTEILDLITAYQREEATRQAAAEAPAIDDWDPPFARYLDDLPAVFEVPGVPKRVEERLVQEVKRALNVLRSVTHYDERERVIALVGLLTLQALGLKPPKASSGRTLFEEYDALMHEHRRRPEFERTSPEPQDERPSE